MILTCQACKKTFIAKYYKKYCVISCIYKKRYSTIFTENEKQLTYTGRLGDGTIFKNTGKYHNLAFSSIHKSYLTFKKSFFKNVSIGNVNGTINSGYKKGTIYQMVTGSHPFISEVYNMSLENVINSLNKFGLLLWFYDDGSYHHKKHFYNLNTHALSYDIQKEVLIPKLKKILDINATIAYDRKKNGKVFTYLRINKVSGNAINITKLLETAPLKCFKYKR